MIIVFFLFIIIFILQPARHSKLEKADILEMTVRHLQSVQRRQQQQQMLQQQMPADVNSLSRFRGGFGECAQEVAKCTKGLTGQDAEVIDNIKKYIYLKIQSG